MAQKSPKGGGTAISGPVDNNEMFLKRALEKLLSEKDIKKSQYQSLKRACEAALGESQLLSTFINTSVPLLPASVSKDTQTTKYSPRPAAPT